MQTQVPVMDKAGRRPLLLYPMIAMNFILILITISLNLQKNIAWMAIISVICVIAYVICFAVGLGKFYNYSWPCSMVPLLQGLIRT